jgi:hypothetical protein
MEWLVVCDQLATSDGTKCPVKTALKFLAPDLGSRSATGVAEKEKANNGSP